MSNKDFQHVRRSTVVKQPSGQRIKVGGYRHDENKESDKRYGASRFAASNLPPSVDLRPYMTPVENQANTNSCTANAMAGAYEYLAQRLRGNASDVSRLFIYYNARDLDGDTSVDEGTYLRSCIKVLREYGACREAIWQFDESRIFDTPNDKAYEEAANFLIEDASRIEVDLDAMRSCLAEGYPFAFGLELFSSFQKAGSRGLVPMPDPDNDQHDGGHAMLCVGYSDTDRVFIVRNSWGEDWGDRGYCYIPYDYMTNPNLNDDLWTIRRVTESDVDLSEGIEGNVSSLFDLATAAIAQSIQHPHTTEIDQFEDDYQVEYEEQLIYVEESGFVPVDQVGNLASFYEQISQDIQFEYSEETSEEEEYDEEESDEEEEYDEEESDEDEDEEEYDEEESDDENDEDEEYEEDEDEESDEEEYDDEEEEEEYEEEESDEEEYEEEEYDDEGAEEEGYDEEE